MVKERLTDRAPIRMWLPRRISLVRSAVLPAAPAVTVLAALEAALVVPPAAAGMANRELVSVTVHHYFSDR
jgi:hypothetical protein